MGSHQHRLTTTELALLPWRAAPASEALRRSFIEPAFDDADWAVVPTPGHWQSTDAFADHDGPLLYRHQIPGLASRSEQPLASDGTRWWLVSEGIHNAADIWFDQAYLGPTEGGFISHEFEITDHVLASPATHTLGIEVISPTPREPGSRAKSLIGIWDHTETVGQAFNAGGIVRPISVVATGPVRMSDLRILCSGANASRATITGAACLKSEEARSVTITTELVDPEGTRHGPFTSEHHLSAGETLIEWQAAVDQPQLWWPHSLGEQPLYEVTVAVHIDGAAEPSDTASRTIGLREVSLHKWQLSINGERLFTKGAVLWPTQRDLARASTAKVEGDILAAKDLGLDLLRVHTHVARPELYAAADREGMLLWQDLPLSGRAARFLKDKAASWATKMVDLLAHHPSVVLWNAHDDPTGTGRRPDRVRSALSATHTVVRQQAPSWNKSILDRAIGSAIERADPSRPMLAHSGAWPSLPLLDGTDSQLWFGWATGTGRDLPAFARNLPRMVRWVSAFGAQSVPTDADFCDPELWPDLNWSHLQGTYGLDRRAMSRYVPTTDHDTFESWVAATQDYQSTVLRRQIEFLRRLKFRPTGGFCFAALADCRPGVSFAILDHDRRPKAAWHAVKAACEPVIVTSDRLPALIEPGDAIALDIHVVNDRRHALPTHRLTATLTWPGGSHTWTWRGQIPADEVKRVGMVNWIATETPGTVQLDLTLVEARSKIPTAANSYSARLASPDQP